MIVPNKVIPLSESALGSVGPILEQGPESIGLTTLFRTVINKFESVDQFILAMDVLYVLDLIDFDETAQVISYAK